MDQHEGRFEFSSLESVVVPQHRYMIERESLKPSTCDQKPIPLSLSLSAQMKKDGDEDSNPSC